MERIWGESRITNVASFREEGWVQWVLGRWGVRGGSGGQRVTDKKDKDKKN